MSNHRADRVAESIRRELPELLRTVKDPRVSALLSVVRVEVTGDLSAAKIYVSAMDGLDATKTSVLGLRSAGGLLRHELGARLGLKKAPTLAFIADDSIAHSAKIADMLKDMAPEQNDKNTDD